MEYVSLMFLGYLCGSIPFGKLIAALHGVDIQRRGSGNIGFANVQRVLGWHASLPTLAGDILKGFLPTLLANILLGPAAAFWVGVAAILGHIFPVWLRFRGGKGVATGLGVVLVLLPLAAVIGSLVYVSGRLIHKKSDRSSLAGIGVVVIIGCLLQPSRWWQYLILLVIALWTLRNNIRGTVPDYDI